MRGYTVPLHDGSRQAGTLALLAYRGSAQRAVSAVLTAIGWASALGILFATLLGLTVVRRSLRPLGRIARQIEAVESAGELSRRIEHAGADDEVGRQAAAFDRMLARLEQAFASQQRLLADASHELRTPLTVAREQLELLADEIAAAPGSSLAVATDELDRMARIVDGLLLLARLDEGLELEREPVEVELVLREALLRAMLLERRDVAVEAQPGVFALADPDRLLQALSNPVTNVVQHTPATAAIALSTAAEDGAVVIRVADTGAGIAAADLPHVFDRLYNRLYRGVRSRARQRSGGAGLGLAITASLVQAMDGTIAVSSTEGVGTTFTIRLPAAEDEDSLMSVWARESGGTLQGVAY